MLADRPSIGPFPLCVLFLSLDEPEAKSSMVWIIGEYAERIDNADELLEAFLETFPEETSMVRWGEAHHTGYHDERDGNAWTTDPCWVRETRGRGGCHIGKNFIDGPGIL